MRYVLIVAALCASAGVTAAAPPRQPAKRAPSAPAPNAAPAAPGAKAKPAPVGDMLVVHSAGLEKLLVEKKDAGLLAALRLVDDRVLELPAELEKPFPAPPLRLALDLLTGPFVLQVGMNPDAAPQSVPIYGQITFTGQTAAEATDAAKGIAAVLQMMTGMPAQPVTGRAGVSRIDLPDGVRVYQGSERAGELAIAFNRLTAPSARPQTGLPKGVEPILTIRGDATAAQPLVEVFLAAMGPDAAEVRNQLRLYNLLGPQASSFTAAIGQGPDRMHAWWRYANYGRFAQRMPTVVREPLTEKDLAMVPEDAVWVSVGRARFGRILDQFRQTVGAEVVDAGLEEATGELGFNPESEILAHLGTTYGFYTSDSTGGGGLLSGVLFAEIANPAAMEASLARVYAKVNDAARGHARGYVRLRTTARNGIQVTTLTFPGLPIPLEPSWAFTKGWLIAGATPQALAAALDRAAGGGRSLLDNRRFREMAGEEWRKSISVTFLDMPRLARGGYGLTSLLCSALSNAVCSPASPDRFQGDILPPLPQLLDGAKASVSVYGFEGEDLVGTSQCDRSMLVNVAGAVGLIGECVPVAAPLLASLTVPALTKAQEEGNAMKSASQARQLVNGVMLYASEHGGAAPTGFAAMMKEAYFGQEVLKSPLGPVSDGRGDYWLNTRLRRVDGSRSPERHIVIYDRAMYESGPTVAVGFLDGRVEVVAVEQFRELVKAAPNAGTNFDLP